MKYIFVAQLVSRPSSPSLFVEVKTSHGLGRPVSSHCNVTHHLQLPGTLFPMLSNGSPSALTLSSHSFSRMFTGSTSV